MATVNRYTKTKNSVYQPRTLQELMVAPAYKRQKHDELDAGIAQYETQLAQANALDLHSEELQNQQKKLYDRMLAQRDKLEAEGFSQSAKSDFLRFNKDYQQAIGPQGTIGKIMKAKEVFEANKAAGIENLVKQGYNPDDAAAYWEEHANKYKEGFDGTTINNIEGLYGTGFRDPVAEAHELMQKAGYDAEALNNDLGTSHIRQDEKGTYVITSKGYEKYKNNSRGIQGVLDYLNKQVLDPNSEVGQSLKIQRRDPQQVVAEIQGLDDIYRDTMIDKASGRTISSFSPNKNNTAVRGALQYEYAPATSVTVFNDSMSNALERVGRQNTTSKGIKMDRGGTGVSNTGSMVTSMGGDRTVTELGTVQNQLNPTQLKEYDRVWNSLRAKDPSLNTLDKYSNEAAVAVKSYFDKNKTILRNDILITDDYQTPYGDRSIGTSKDTQKKIGDVVKSNPDKRKYFIEGVNNDRAMSYDELPSEIQKNFKELTYSGYYSPKNFMTDKYGKDENKNLFVSPIELQYRNDKGEIINIYAGRSASEMNSPEFKADKEFNDVFINTNKFPDIPYELPNKKGTEIIYLSTPVQLSDGSIGSYLINKKDKDGNYGAPVIVSEQNLQTLFLMGYGATPTNVKK
jgi:hypothetical protein